MTIQHSRRHAARDGYGQRGHGALSGRKSGSPDIPTSRPGMPHNSAGIPLSR
jgi:hypothetical protein